MKKRVLFEVIGVLVLVTMFASVATYSFSGWNVYNGQNVYLDTEGRMLLNVWRESNGEMYYLGADGYVAKNTLLDYNGFIYFLDENGRKIRNGFFEVTDNHKKVPEELKSGIYYFDDKGHAFTRTGSNFKKVIDGKSYGFNEDGIRFEEGWYDEDGEPLNDFDNILSNGIYHADENGCLSRNVWYRFGDDIGAYHYDSDYNSYAISDSYDDMQSLWMYFDNNCKKVRSTDNDNYKRKKIDSIDYGFDENGIMIEGLTRMNAGLNYEQLSNPTMNESVKLYSKNDGSLQTGTWNWTTPSKELSEEDYYSNIKSWFYTEKDTGAITYNKIRNIGNHKYIFDGIGRMRTGFCLMHVKGQFIASYKPEDLTKEDFIFPVTGGGKLFGSDINDLYFCGTDEFNDGDIRSGKMKIELDGGEYEFLFRNSGKPYGANNKIQLYSNYYYINGLKLKAWNDNKYGVVKVANDEYRVIDSNGRLVKAKKKMIKDDYDNYMIILNDKLAGYITGNIKAGVGDYIKIRWQSKPKGGGDAGYYYYNKNTEVKKYVGVAVLSGTTCPTAEELAEIPIDMRVNYK